MNADEIRTLMDETAAEARRALDAASGPDALEAWRIAYLGRKGRLSSLTGMIPSLPPERRKDFGAAVNALKNLLTGLFEERTRSAGSRAKSENLSFPGRRPRPGALHPLTAATREIVSIFTAMGFGVVAGPEAETDYYNFEALNTPADHPARDMWDTFYLEPVGSLLLRTHTSPVQIRTMERIRPPFKIVAVGRCFRRDAADATHSPVFHQMEGLMVGEAGAVRFSDLKGVLTLFLRRLFGDDRSVRFTPSYFPFTEPSAEVSISCGICAGRGCPSCGQSGWLEILGAGMVHPQVFRSVGYDPAAVSGFAFGMGIERIAMLAHGITDIRYFTQNDMRFIEQLS